MIEEIVEEMGFTEEQAKFCDLLTEISYKAGYKAAMDRVEVVAEGITIKKEKSDA